MIKLAYYLLLQGTMRLHGGWALCRIVHLFSWHNSTTTTFSAILILQNTPYSAKNFHR